MKSSKKNVVSGSLGTLGKKIPISGGSIFPLLEHHCLKCSRDDPVYQALS